MAALVSVRATRDPPLRSWARHSAIDAVGPSPYFLGIRQARLESPNPPRILSALLK
jgi:hypothetical protein